MREYISYFIIYYYLNNNKYIYMFILFYFILFYMILIFVLVKLLIFVCGKFRCHYLILYSQIWGASGARFLAPRDWRRLAINAGSAPINLLMLTKAHEHGLVKLRPHACRTPIALASPACHAASVAQTLR